MQLLRKVLFYIFAAIYVVTCPLLILYSFGYILKPDAKEGYAKTGLIYLSTVPAGASIFVDGKKNSENAPAAARDLLPEDHSVKIELEGYRIWSQAVPVEAEKATVLDRIILIPDEWEGRKILEGAFSGLLTIPESGFFLARSGPRAGDIQVCDYSTEKAWPLLEKGSPHAGLAITGIFTMKESPAVVFAVKTREGTRFLQALFSQDANTVKDITDLLQQKPDKIKWSPSQEDLIFFLSGNTLKKIDIKKEAVYPEYMKNVKGYGLLDSRVYVLGDDNTIISYDREGNASKSILDDAETGKNIFGTKEKFDIEVLSPSLMLFIGEEGGLLANKLPYRFVEKGVRGVEYYPQRSYLLVWQKDRIGVVDFTSEETGAVSFEKGPKLLWIYEKGRDIKQCFWVYDASHVLFRDGSDIFLLGIESFGEFTLERIFSVKKGTDIYYSDGTGKMYFLDSPQGTLRSVEILPKAGIVEEPFPGITGARKKTKIQELWSSGLQGTD